MKKLTTLLFIVASAFVFAACGDDGEKNIKSMMFVGQFSTEIAGSEMDNISLQTTFHKKEGICDITLWNIKFASVQNRIYNMTINGIKCEITDTDTVISGTNFTPNFSVASYSVGSLDFTVREVNATIKDGHISFKSTVYTASNDLELTFEGDLKK